MNLLQCLCDITDFCCAFHIFIFCVIACLIISLILLLLLLSLLLLLLLSLLFCTLKTAFNHQWFARIVVCLSLLSPTLTSPAFHQ